LLVTAAILIFAMTAYQRIGTYPRFRSHQNDAMAYVAGRLGASWWRPILPVTVIVSTAATLWTTVLDLSPSLFSLSALAAMRLVASRSGPRRFASLGPGARRDRARRGHRDRRRSVRCDHSRDRRRGHHPRLAVRALATPQDGGYRGDVGVIAPASPLIAGEGAAKNSYG